MGGVRSIGLVKPPCQVVIVRPADGPDHSTGRVCFWTAIKPPFQTRRTGTVGFHELA